MQRTRRTTGPRVSQCGSACPSSAARIARVIGANRQLSPWRGEGASLPWIFRPTFRSHGYYAAQKPITNPPLGGAIKTDHSSVPRYQPPMRALVPSGCIANFDSQPLSDRRERSFDLIELRMMGDIQQPVHLARRTLEPACKVDLSDASGAQSGVEPELCFAQRRHPYHPYPPLQPAGRG